ncbi:MAG TPA: hypothetical protein VK988_12165 [Acidimicrobiales bacterium]|nr:hypothetical protein [Acidimicrobiales bacterium]
MIAPRQEEGGRVSETEDGRAQNGRAQNVRAGNGHVENGHAKGGKASFDHIYNQPDPRPYFQTLAQFGYEIPAHGQAMFSVLVGKLLEEQSPEDLAVLDLCCSYGVNAALLNHDLTLDDLYERYRSPELAGLSSQDLADDDADFYARRRRSPMPMLGIDTADQAVDYASRAGLLADGSHENLEIADPSEGLRRCLAGVSLITVTGGIGYISEHTFDRVLQATGGAPWVASFALRWVPYAPITAVLEKHGLVTETLAKRTFPQRRFTDEAERSYVIDELERIGIDPTGKEAEGQYHADFYLSRPAAHVEAQPLEELVAGV